MVLLVMSAVWGDLHAVASRLAGLCGAWLCGATGRRASQEFTVIGGVVERIRSCLVCSLVRLLLFLLHRMCVGVLVRAARTGEEGAVGRRRRGRCRRAPLSEFEILRGTILIHWRPHRHILFESVAAYPLVSLPGAPSAEMSGCHLLAEVSKLPEPHRVMVLTCTRPTLMVSGSSSSVLLRAQASSVPPSRRRRPLLSYSHRVPLIILLLGLLYSVRLIWESLSVITFVVLHFGGAHVSDGTAADSCQRRSRSRA